MNATVWVRFTVKCHVIAIICISFIVTWHSGLPFDTLPLMASYFHACIVGWGQRSMQSFKTQWLYSKTQKGFDRINISSMNVGEVIVTLFNLKFPALFSPPLPAFSPFSLRLCEERSFWYLYMTVCAHVPSCNFWTIWPNHYRSLRFCSFLTLGQQ